MKRRLSFAAPLLVIACHHGGGAPAHYNEWNVFNTGSQCLAEDPGPERCPRHATCNPPPPKNITCPDGLEPQGDPVRVYQDVEGGACYVQPASDAGAPVEIACPGY